MSKRKLSKGTGKFKCLNLNCFFSFPLGSAKTRRFLKKVSKVSGKWFELFHYFVVGECVLIEFFSGCLKVPCPICM